MEPSDVVVECAKLAIGGESDRPREEGRGSSRTSQDFTNTFGKSHTVLKLRCINKSTFFILKSKTIVIDFLNSNPIPILNQLMQMIQIL